MGKTSKRRKNDPLMAEIDDILIPGCFVPSDDVFELTSELDRMDEKIEALVRVGEAQRAVRLYEILLAGIYAKIEETDDECYLAMSFSNAFCGWIEARQAAGFPSAETLVEILKWMKNDNYGFCYRIEKEVVKVLNAEGRRLFIGHFEALVEKATPRLDSGQTKAIFEYENNLRLPALTLKEIYESRTDVSSYAALCERLGFSPLDCGRLTKLEMSKKRWFKALEWVEKGVAFEPTRNWRNESSHSLEHLRPDILRKMGRKKDALAAAWADFESAPDEFAYEELMHHVPKAERSTWQERALTAAATADLSAFVSLCVQAKAWERLASRVHSATPAELEALSHYCSEPAAKGLAKKDSLAAASLYRALGMRILNAGKSKYYAVALEHFKRARNMYSRTDQTSEWEELVQTVRTTHSRKSGFVSAFEKIVSGTSQLSTFRTPTSSN